MELPHIGNNCALSQCNRLDFLPVKCDACSNVFCLEHYCYETHNCAKATRKDNQVPVCPLCSEPVAARRGQLPDFSVSEHIDKHCKNNHLARTKPKVSNLQSCNFKSCKQKDLIYLECNDCNQKFCIKHRHPTDHTCSGPSLTSNVVGNWLTFKETCTSGASSSLSTLKNKAQQISKSGQAAINRLTSASNSVNSRINPNVSTSNPIQRVAALQGSIGEHEALAIAINESKATSGIRANVNGLVEGNHSDDDELARAIYESQLEEARRRPNQTSRKDNCVLS